MLDTLRKKVALALLPGSVKKDALVWTITELMLGQEEQEAIVMFDAIKEFGLTGLEL